MNADIPDAPSARLFLFGAEPSVARLAAELDDNHLVHELGTRLRGLSGEARRALNEEVAATTDRLLDLDVGDLLLAGWRKHQALRAAARATLAAADSEEIVVLASHRLTADHTVPVEILIDDVRVSTLDLGLAAVCDVYGLIVVVRRGLLAEVKSGECALTLTLQVKGIELARRSARVDSRLVIRPGAGIPLLSDEEVRKTFPSGPPVDGLILPPSSGPESGASG